MAGVPGTGQRCRLAREVLPLCFGFGFLQIHQHFRRAGAAAVPVKRRHGGVELWGLAERPQRNGVLQGKVPRAGAGCAGGTGRPGGACGSRC
jgi:hypothetical protein